VAKHVVLDLGLINHMDYYSDMIFQGFIERVARPVLMGGRYDQLADQFAATIPAIGFACDIDLVLEGTPDKRLSSLNVVDVTLVYADDEQQACLQLANELRNKNLRVLTYALKEDSHKQPQSRYTAQLYPGKWELIKGDDQIPFNTSDELVKHIEERK